MKMRAVHGQEIQGGEPYQRAGGHKIEVAGVGEGKVPEDDQRSAQDGNKKVRQVKIFLILGTSTLLLLLLSLTFPRVLLLLLLLWLVVKMLVSLLLLLARLLGMDETVDDALVKETAALERVFLLFEDFTVEDEADNVVGEDFLEFSCVVGILEFIFTLGGPCSEKNISD
jgi:hypothetical protein